MNLNISAPSSPASPLRRRGNLLDVGKRILALAFNSAAERCIAYSIATNIAPITDGESADDYKLLAPYGDTDYWIEDGKGSFKKLIQRFTPPQAAKAVAAFNAYRVRQGKSFIGMPIYRGHPDADPVRWPDDRRYGHLLDVQQRDDGLYAKPAWNDLGLDNKKNHYLPYPSIAWLYDEASAQRTGVIEPDEIQSVGLTNQPRMKNVPVWTNQDPAGASQFSANNPLSPAGDAQKTTTTKEPKMNHKARLVSLLNKHHGATLDDGSADESIESAYQKAMEKAAPKVAKNVALVIGSETFQVVPSEGTDEAKLLAQASTLATNVATATTTATNATEEAKKFRGLAINAHLDRGIDKAIITAAERPDWQTKFEKDFDATLVEFNAKKVALNTKPLDPLKPLDHADLSTPRGRTLAFNTRVDEIQAEALKNGGHAISIDRAIDKMRGNAADAALLKAMEPTSASK